MRRSSSFRAWIRGFWLSFLLLSVLFPCCTAPVPSTSAAEASSPAAVVHGEWDEEDWQRCDASSAQGGGSKGRGPGDGAEVSLKLTRCWLAPNSNANAEAESGDGKPICHVQVEAEISGPVSAKGYFSSVARSWGAEIRVTAGGSDIYRGPLGDIEGNATLIRSFESATFLRRVVAGGLVPCALDEMLAIQVTLGATHDDDDEDNNNNNNNNNNNDVSVLNLGVSGRDGGQHASAGERQSRACGACPCLLEVFEDEQPSRSVREGPADDWLTKGFKAWGRGWFGPPASAWRLFALPVGSVGRFEGGAAQMTADYLPITGLGGGQREQADWGGAGEEEGGLEVGRKQSSEVAYHREGLSDAENNHNNEDELGKESGRWSVQCSGCDDSPTDEHTSSPEETVEFVIVAPVRNSAAAICLCIQSVVAQRHLLWRMVVVDDDSTGLETNSSFCICICVIVCNVLTCVHAISIRMCTRICVLLPLLFWRPAVFICSWPG
jgi:hypothetical protein